MLRRHFPKACALAIAGLASLVSATALAQAYPDQPVKWVVPYPAGGGTDNLARTLAESMRTGLGQQIVVDNRPGAATNIGAELVARSKADGYTVMSADNALMAFNEHLFKKLPVNPEKDFTYIGGIGKFPLVLVVHPDFPARSYAEFAAYVKAQGGKVNYASVGNGSPHHLAMELFKQRTGLAMNHVPYKGAAPAMADVMGGQVPVMFLDLASGLSIIKSGKVRPLAIGTKARTQVLPDVPTFQELGVRDTEVFAFQGLLGPANLPASVTQRLNRELVRALSEPEVLKRFADFAFEPIRLSPEEFRKMARDESARWGAVIKATNISLD